MEPKIIYEDEFVLGLDKPSGLLVHNDGKHKEKTLVDWIMDNRPEVAEVGEEQILQNGERIKRPGIVHRLDRETSGVILVAKTQKAHQFLKEQFQNRKVEKIYHAVVWGSVKDKEGIIDRPIGRGMSGKWSASGIQGKSREAVTEYRVIGRGGNNSLNKFAYLEVRPKTGRTHQIRVHLKSINYPVVCDKLYAPKMICDGSSSCFGFSRLALHAFSIKLELPNHSFVTIESPLPSEFEKILNLIQ